MNVVLFAIINSWLRPINHGLWRLVKLVANRVPVYAKISFSAAPKHVYNYTMVEDDELPLQEKLNLETGRISWPELQRYFARGVIIIVGPQLDLLEVAQLMAMDQATQLEQLIQQAKIIRATDEHAKDWQARNPLFWSVVVAPWVLVQEITS